MLSTTVALTTVLRLMARNQLNRFISGRCLRINHWLHWLHWLDCPQWLPLVTTLVNSGSTNPNDLNHTSNPYLLLRRFSNHCVSDGWLWDSLHMDIACVTQVLSFAIMSGAIAEASGGAVADTDCTGEPSGEHWAVLSMGWQSVDWELIACGEGINWH